MLLLAPSLLCAILPMVGFLGVVWWLDRYQREPVWLVLIAFCWGAFGGVFFGILASLILLAPLPLVTTPSMVDALGTALVAPIAEEPAKAVILLVLVASRSFTRVTDGFVYGAAAGLGFGMVENFLYFTTVGFYDPFEIWVQTIFIRTFYSAVMHATATSLVGAALGWACFRSRRAMWGAGLVGLGGAIAIHVIWNGLITLDVLWEMNGALQALNLVLLPVQVLLVLTCFQLALFDESRTILQELQEEARRGHLPHDHPRILASWRARRHSGWLPPEVDHARYVRCATQLALRKAQARQAQGDDVPFYRDEVTRLRRRLARLVRGQMEASPRPRSNPWARAGDGRPEHSHREPRSR